MKKASSSFYICLVYFTYFIISGGLSVQIVKSEEKPERVKRMIDGGDMAPLPMRSSNTASNTNQNSNGAQEVPYVETHSQTFDVSVGDSDNSNDNNNQDNPPGGTNTAGQGQSQNPGSSQYGSSSYNYGTASRNTQYGYNTNPGGTSYRSYPQRSRTRSQGRTYYYNNNPGYGSYYASQGGSTYPQYTQGSGINSGRMSNDPNCPRDQQYRVLINNMDCARAIDTIGKFLCYNYERSSRECCEKCLSVKQTSQIGCEYGDQSYQCPNIEPFDCYSDRIREICCERCRQFDQQMRTGIRNCQYGDLTPRCTTVTQMRHYCYFPENQRLCCITCPRMEDRSRPDCKWGDQEPTMCSLYTTTGRLRINCYQQSIKDVCCGSCERLKNRFIGEGIPGCEYGNRPVQFRTLIGNLDCSRYVATYGVEVCNNSDVNTHCCFTCHRYRQRQRRGQSG